MDCRSVPDYKTLSRMLGKGEIDVLITARTPSCFLDGSPNVGRLFRDYSAEEQAYYQRTGIFPIMHCVVIRRAVYEAEPWVAMALYKACRVAKDRALANLRDTNALYASLPWLVQEVESTREIMGDDWWPYGVEKNRDAIEALCQYSFEQGLAACRMDAGELLAPETLDEFKV